jgi:dipeptidyl aminopeptidase/acylaminoacyl peptidase
MAKLLERATLILVFTSLLAISLQAASDGEIIQSKETSLSQEMRTRVMERSPGRFDFVDSVTVQEITYLSDGLKVKGYLVIPKGEEPYPCLIVNRGGNREFGEISEEAAILWLGRMASEGYVVIATQYRGVAGGEGMEEFGGAEINDVLNLFPILDSLPEADGSRIGMWGASRGGMMTYLAVAKTDRIKAAVVVAGMSDSFDTVKRRPGMEKNVYSQLVPDWENNREAALVARSPIRWVEKLNKQTPFLLIHGSADWRVHPTQTLNMADSLLERSHPFRLVIFEGGDHSLTDYRDEETRITRDFLNHYVRDNSPLPNMEPHGD